MGKTYRQDKTFGNNKKKKKKVNRLNDPRHLRRLKNQSKERILKEETIGNA